MKKIILDSDFSSDIDDCGDLLLCLVLHKLGLIELIGINISSSNTKAPGAANAMCIAMGLPDMPIGCWKGVALDPSGPGVWVPAVYDGGYTRTLELASTVQDGLAMYQSLLAANGNVTVVATGGANSLSELLAASPALVVSNIDELVWAVGQYPTNPSGEFNIAFDNAAATDVMANWPTEITYTGYENGLMIITGSNLKHLDTSDIFRFAYAAYSAGLTGRSAWGQQAVMWAVFGKSLFGVVRGANAVSNSPTANSNVFTQDAGGKDAYITRTMSDPDYAGTINTFLAFRGGPLSQPSATKTVLMVS